MNVGEYKWIIKKHSQVETWECLLLCVLSVAFLRHFIYFDTLKCGFSSKVRRKACFLQNSYLRGNGQLPFPMPDDTIRNKRVE